MSDLTSFATKTNMTTIEDQSKETKREENVLVNNDNLEMVLSSEQVQKLLKNLDFSHNEIDLWKDQIEIPIGVSMELFVIREVILHGLHFQHLDQYPGIEIECRKGKIPSWVTEKVESVEPRRFIAGIADNLYPSHIYVYKIQKPSIGQDQTKILSPLKTNPNQYFLYRGFRTLNIIPAFIKRAVPYLSSVNNEFGPGIYYTPNFDLAVEYSGSNGAIFVYDWSDFGGNTVVTKTLDRDWADTVKGWICIEDDKKPGPPQHTEDILQGPVTQNNSSVYNGGNPIQSDKLQVVGASANGMNAIAARLYAIICLY